MVNVNMKKVFLAVLLFSFVVYYRFEILNLYSLLNWKPFLQKEYMFQITYPQSYELNFDKNVLHISNYDVLRSPKDRLYFEFEIFFDSQYYSEAIQNSTLLKNVNEENIIVNNKKVEFKLTNEEYYPRSIYEYWIFDVSELKNVQVKILFYKSKDPIKNIYYRLIFLKIKNSIKTK